MTLRTSSATRRRVVSRSRVVLTTSATSRSSGSILDSSGWVVAVSTDLYDNSRCGRTRTHAYLRNQPVFVQRNYRADAQINQKPVTVLAVQRKYREDFCIFRR